jgi:diaminopimelate epimerase
MIFEKYCASGNDFLISHQFIRKDFSKLAKKLCNRHYGFGADGLIVLIPCCDADFEWLFYNSDGSKANMCGNGARAAALYAQKNNLANKKMKFLTKAGFISAEVFAKNIVKAELTKPKIINEKIAEYGLEWFFVDSGVPHLCAIVKNLSNFDIDMARTLRHKYNANVNIFQINNSELFVRTYERGVEDETLACGTGMAACALYASKIGSAKNEKIVVFPKSLERIEVLISGGSISLKGAVIVVGSCLQSA